jgi:hypothetical protein
MYKNFLQEVSEVQNPNESSSDELQLPEKQSTPRGPKEASPGRLSGTSVNTNWTKMLLMERSSSIMTDSVSVHCK